MPSTLRRELWWQASIASRCAGRSRVLDSSKNLKQLMVEEFVFSSCREGTPGHLLHLTTDLLHARAWVLSKRRANDLHYVSRALHLLQSSAGLLYPCFLHSGGHCWNAGLCWHENRARGCRRARGCVRPRRVAGRLGGYGARRSLVHPDRRGHQRVFCGPPVANRARARVLAKHRLYGTRCLALQEMLPQRFMNGIGRAASLNELRDQVRLLFFDLGKGPQHARKADCKDVSVCDERYWGSNACSMEPQRRPPQSALKPGSRCCERSRACRPSRSRHNLGEGHRGEDFGAPTWATPNGDGIGDGNALFRQRLLQASAAMMADG